MPLTPFHIAVQVRDIDEAREFYGVKMGLAEGRSTTHWIDFNMFGHQFVTHLNPQIGKTGKITGVSNPVDEHSVPVPHCGVVMHFDDWERFADKVRGFIDHFIIEPYIRFKGEPGEQGTMFFSDPSGNALEFKAFKNIEENLFATDVVATDKKMEKNRLFWGSRRGMLELDLILMPFLENRYDTLPESDQQLYGRLLEEQDQDLFSWFLERQDPEDPELLRIVNIIRDNTKP